MLLMLLLFLFLFVLFIIWVWMAIGSAVVAVTKNRNPVIWCIAGLFFGPFAFLVLTRLPQGNTVWGNLRPLDDDSFSKERTCVQCGATNPQQNRYCNDCGESLARARVQPPKLGQARELDEGGEEAT